LKRPTIPHSAIALLIGVIVACILLVACVTAPPLNGTIERKTYILSPGQVVAVEFESGQLEIEESPDSRVTISGHYSSTSSIAVETTQDPSELRIRLQAERAPFSSSKEQLVHLLVSVPSGLSLSVNTFNGEIVINGLADDVSVTTVAGNIHVNDVDGTLVLNSDRGDILVTRSRGVLRLIGSHGLLSMRDTSGIVNASSIVGSVRFTGLIKYGDSVHLETDHAPVEVQLSGNSGLRVEVKTTSGAVHCSMPGIEPMGTGCAGRFGNGEGLLSIRTVSGDVTIRPLP
jgi:DUF4097 and DUF4098 domain-containing protein YvlB